MTSRTTITVPLPACAAREHTASVADLREMIAAARSEIVEAGVDTQQRMELALELRRIVAALESGRPDLAPVRDRWKRVLSLLGPAAGTGRVAQITDLLILLLRAR